MQRQKLAELENVELTQLRDWLLPLLMNGQVKPADL
jgi:type I restriction enzyme S subunit